MVAHLKLVIAKLRRERFGPSAERGSKLLDQLELQLEELEASATEDALAVTTKSDQDDTVVRSFTRQKPVRAPLPEHLPRERVVMAQAGRINTMRLAQGAALTITTVAALTVSKKVLHCDRNTVATRSPPPARRRVQTSRNMN